MTVAEKLKSWLDEIGADGLMVNMSSSDHVYLVGSELERAIESWGLDSLVPAFRHADGSYHVEPEHWFLCKTCICDCMPIGDDACSARFDAHECTPYQSWLSHKGATK